MANEINSMEDLEALIGQQATAVVTEQNPVAAVEAPLILTSAEDTEQPKAEVAQVVEAPAAPAAVEVVLTPAVEAAPVRVQTAAEIKRQKVKDVLNSMTIDISKIDIMKSDNPLGTFQELDNLFLKPSYEVIALQSGYRAAFKPLNNNDMITVRKFSGTEREQNLKLFSFVFKQMVNSNLGKINFETWLNITSEADFETLIYGIYCATFPEDGDYNISCPHCSKENKTKIGKEHLIQAKDEKATGAYIRDLLSKNYPASELVKHSVVNQTKRIILPESKMIFELNTPTMADYLRTLQRAETHVGIEPEMFGYLKHVSKIMIPHLQSFAEGTPRYLELETIEDKIRAVVDMPAEDRKVFNKEIGDKRDQYKVEYKLPDLTCVHTECGKPITNITVDLTEVLFQNMARV